jgi:CoA binding protein
MRLLHLKEMSALRLKMQNLESSKAPTRRNFTSRLRHCATSSRKNDGLQNLAADRCRFAFDQSRLQPDHASPSESTIAPFGFEAEIMGIERYDQLVQEFLGKKRIAIWGIQDAKSDPGHLVAGKLREQGIEVIAVNPRFSDDPTQRRASSLTKIQPPVEAVLVYVDRPQTMEAVEDHAG